MDALALEPSERALLEALNALGVRYLVVGMSAALLQGARGVTDDVDLWFERTDDPRIGEAARAAGGFWISGAFGMRPPGLGGLGLEDRFDVVLTANGLDSFAEEYARAKEVVVDGLALRVLPLDRIVVSKRAAGRPKDQAQLPALEAALAVERDEAGDR
jgi:predicted nucleotidyltransferase